MASGSGEHTESDKDQEEQLPQITPEKGQGKKRMRGTAKSSKPPKAPKKKVEKVPTVSSKKERKQEEDAASEDPGMSVLKTDQGKVVVVVNQTPLLRCLTLEPYKTPPHGETLTERNSRLQRIKRKWAKKWFNYENVHEKYALLFAFHPPWNECIAEGCIREGEEKVRPPQPQNAHPSSIKTPADYPKEVERRAKAKAKREKKAAKADKIEAENVTLTQQDVEKKKERASASKASALKKNTAAASDAAKPRKKTLAKRSKKAANSSDDGGYSSDFEEEGPEENLPKKNAEEVQYDQKAILDNPTKSTLSKALLSPRRSPRHAVEKAGDMLLQ